MVTTPQATSAITSIVGTTGVILVSGVALKGIKNLGDQLNKPKKTKLKRLPTKITNL